MRHLPLLAIAAVALPGPVAAQQAAWAQDSREPACVYDGLIASASGEPMEPARVGVVRDECRQRFGWTEDQANRGVAVAMILFQMMRADREAREAGADPAVIDAVMHSFNDADAASLGRPGEPVTDQGRATIERIGQRVRARGLSGETARKATLAVLFEMMAGNIVAGFAQEVMAPPAR